MAFRELIAKQHNVTCDVILIMICKTVYYFCKTFFFKIKIFLFAVSFGTKETEYFFLSFFLFQFPKTYHTKLASLVLLTLSAIRVFAFLSDFLHTHAPWAFMTPYLKLPWKVLLFLNTEGSNLLETSL